MRNLEIRVLSYNFLGLNSTEMLTAIRTLSSLEHIEAYERMAWFVVEIASTFNTSKLYEDEPELQSGKDAIISALEQFGILEGILNYICRKQRNTNRIINSI